MTDADPRADFLAPAAEQVGPAGRAPARRTAAARATSPRMTRSICRWRALVSASTRGRHRSTKRPGIRAHPRRCTAGGAAALAGAARPASATSVDSAAEIADRRLEPRKLRGLAVDDVLVGVVGVVLPDQAGARLVPDERRELLAVELLQERQQVGHALCFSLQAMHTRVHGNGVEPCRGDRFAAVTTDAVRALLDPPERFLDGLKDLGVGLLQLQRDVDLVVAARLIRHVALARIVLHRGLQRLDAAGPENLAAFPEQRLLVVLLVH